MSAGMRRAAQAGAIALVLAFAGHARADVVGSMPNQPLTSTPFDLNFGAGAATFAFTTVTTGYGPGAWVATGGNGMVTSFAGALSDFGAGASIDQTGELYSFSAFPTPTMIPFSAADDFIGLEFTDISGLHYGYAEVNGPELVSYGYESTPGASILTGAVPVPVSVPEPASLGLLMGGIIAMGATLRRARS